MFIRLFVCALAIGKLSWELRDRVKVSTNTNTDIGTGTVTGPVTATNKTTKPKAPITPLPSSLSFSDVIVGQHEAVPVTVPQRLEPGQLEPGELELGQLELGELEAYDEDE